jgi:aarF domain-containing kinase
VTTDWAALIDAWAVRFLHEMDYEREARNAAVFQSQMEAAGVTGVVTAPVVGQLSNDVVLTTAWIEGEGGRRWGDWSDWSDWDVGGEEELGLKS